MSTKDIVTAFTAYKTNKKPPWVAACKTWLGSACSYRVEFPEDFRELKRKLEHIK